MRARSIGLSSTNTRLSTPMLSLAAMALRFCALSSQFAWKAAKIRAAQRHFRVVAERRLGDLDVVLGAHGQNDAALLELLGVMLQGEMRFPGGAAFAQNDAVEPVVADHAAPKRVVEIEHQTLLRQAPLGGKNAGGKVAVEGRGLRRNFQLAVKPTPDIEPGVD